MSVGTNFNFPQFTFVRNSDGVRTKTLSQTGLNTSTTNLVSSIVFPEKTTMSFLYSSSYNQSQIKISDSVFRYGYILNFQDTVGSGGAYCRKLLKSVTPYTSKQKNAAYTFAYNTPLLAALGSAGDTIQNKRDYWGYYNGAANGTNLIPQVNGYTWGANRTSNVAYAIQNSLSNFNLPNGGSVFYEYELNDHLPYIKDPHSLTISPTTTMSSSITLSQIFKTSHQITFVLDSSVSRTGSPPITGTGNMIVNIKSPDGTITYKSDTLSLYDLFYHGIKTWAFTIPNATYKFEQLAASGTITGSFPIYVRYENKLSDVSHTSTPAGGLRIKRITHKFSSTGTTAAVQEFQYINADGTSSGFLGDIPKCDYPYLETVNYNGVTTTSYTTVSSDPVNTMSYAQGNPVGYSRVVVINGTATHNVGKTVYDFTSLQDVNANFNTEVFPYVPQDLKDWGVGLPKAISVYDSVGTLVKKTVNNYTFDSSFYINDNFKSLKTGNSFTLITGNPVSNSSTKAATYMALEYYPISGHAYLASSFDTLFQSNGSLNTSYLYYTYDTNYNVIKTVASYDRNRGLQLETRLYYPYNYTITGPIKTLRDSSIISPVIASESWITGDANPRILSGSITDYQQTAGGYIKPLASYALQSNAPVSQTTIGSFNPALLNRNSTWFIKQNNFISYDSKGNLLQTQNVLSGVNNSVIVDYGQQYPIARVSNAAYNDVAYSSFESDGTGNWTIASALRDTLNSITGKKSYNLSNGNITKSGLSSSTTYLVSMWVKAGATVTVNGAGLGSILASQGVWNLYNIYLSGVTTVTISGSGSIDELRLHPKNANMITSTYEPLIGVTSTTDANNTITYNEYDNLNRLKIVRDKDRNILKRYDYSDTAMLISLAPVWVFQSSGCEAGQNGLTDSIFIDTNVFSQTYQGNKVITHSNLCTCSAFGAHPDYKIVNGVCEQAQLCCTASIYTKVVNPDGSYSFKWKCTNHYKWSDGSISADFATYNSSSCYIGCTLAP